VNGFLAGGEQPRRVIRRADRARGYDKTQNLKALHHLETQPT